VRLFNGNITSLAQLTYNGELDQRYIKSNNITGLVEAFVEDDELNNLNDKFIKINENKFTPNFNNGLNVSGVNLNVKNEAFFESGVEIRGRFFLNDREILINADGILYSPNIGAGVTPPLT